jgi:hypothetical protein
MSTLYITQKLCKLNVSNSTIRNDKSITNYIITHRQKDFLPKIKSQIQNIKGRDGIVRILKKSQESKPNAHDT